MSADIVDFPGPTSLPIPVDKVLDCVREEGFDSVIVIGCGKDGEVKIFSSDSYKPDLLWLLELAKIRLMEP
jgi:hypothetical protein